MRVDGIFRELMKVPSIQHGAVTLCFKNLADLNPAEQLPQDGRFLIICKGRRLDVRVSTMPTYFGEKIVVRIIDPRRTLLTLDQLGMSRQHENSLKQVLGLPQGMLIISGPRVAGKSTTLCSAVNFVASPERSVISIEDAVEYVLPGVTQIQANPQAGWTIAGSLPRILRHNPNVIMIGEIHDRETAECALQAAKTGHLVLTPLCDYAN
jgi:type II secretory ATPase GspE/PulE/Tfp pilus assembly ATPase PilB-like protein